MNEKSNGYFFLVHMAYNKAPTKEELRKWGRWFSRKGDKIKIVDIRFKG